MLRGTRPAIAASRSSHGGASAASAIAGAAGAGTATAPRHCGQAARAGRPGVSFVSSVGELRGAPLQEGAFPIRIRATDAIGLQDEVLLTLDVGPPSVGLLEMARPFLGGPTLSPVLASFLDFQGNRSGDYDLADFRTYVVSHPNAPASAPEVTIAEPIRIPMFVRREGSR